MATDFSNDDRGPNFKPRAHDDDLGTLLTPPAISTDLQALHRAFLGWHHERSGFVRTDLNKGDAPFNIGPLTANDRRIFEYASEKLIRCANACREHSGLSPDASLQQLSQSVIKLKSGEAHVLFGYLSDERGRGIVLDFPRMRASVRPEPIPFVMLKDSGSNKLKVENCFTLRCLEQESAVIERDWRRMIDDPSLGLASGYVVSPLMQYIWDCVSNYWPPSAREVLADGGWLGPDHLEVHRGTGARAGQYAFAVRAGDLHGVAVCELLGDGSLTISTPHLDRGELCTEFLRMRSVGIHGGGVGLDLQPLLGPEHRRLFSSALLADYSSDLYLNSAGDSRPPRLASNYLRGWWRNFLSLPVASVETNDAWKNGVQLEWLGSAHRGSEERSVVFAAKDAAGNWVYKVGGIVARLEYGPVAMLFQGTDGVMEQGYPLYSREAFAEEVGRFMAVDREELESLWAQSYLLCEVIETAREARQTELSLPDSGELSGVTAVSASRKKDEGTDAFNVVVRFENDFTVTVILERDAETGQVLFGTV